MAILTALLTSHRVAEKIPEQRGHTEIRQHEKAISSSLSCRWEDGEWAGELYLWWGRGGGVGADGRRWIPASWASCQDLIRYIFATLIRVTNSDLGGKKLHKKQIKPAEVLKLRILSAFLVCYDSFKHHKKQDTVNSILTISVAVIIMALLWHMEFALKLINNLL